MTKEELLANSYQDGYGTMCIPYIDVDKFFSQNVCIPKDSVIQTNIVDMKTWVEIPSSQWRIKPSKPIYEWQWVLEKAFIGEIARTRFMTGLEYVDAREELKPFVRDEETKRVRNEIH